MGIDPILFGKHLHQLFLHLFGGLALGQAQPLGDTKHMGIHRKGGDAKGIGQDHIGGLASHTR